MENLTVQNIVNGYKEKRFSPVEITNYYLNRIEKNQDLNAYITVLQEQAMDQAKIAEHKMMAGLLLGKLEGVPISYKDNLYTKGIRSTSGSKIHQDFIPDYNAFVVDKLQSAGTINLGKVNMHEYAFGITSNNPFYGPVKNPWNRAYTPGGSSGGSGAAVAADLCAVSIGTDTGGSVRIPASSCGIVGLKPTFGSIDMSGTKKLAWTLDHIGPLTKDVTDLAFMMEVLTNEDYSDVLNEDIRGVRIGVPRNYFTDRIDEDVLRLYNEALKNLESLGAILIDVDVPFKEEDSAAVLTLAVSEAGFIHRENIKSQLDNFGPDVKQILASSKEIQAMDYIYSLKKTEEVKEGFNELFKTIDVLATPSLAIMPQKIGVDDIIVGGQQEDVFSATIRYPSVFNVSGHPALSIPCGTNKDNLPVGLQLAGANYNEKKLVHVAYAFEQIFLKEFYKERNKVLD